MDDLIKINYEHFHFGPFLYKTKIKEKEINNLLSLCKKDQSKDYRTKLAGHLKHEYSLPTNKVMKILRPYYLSYCKALSETRGMYFKKPLNMNSAWVNYMRKGEPNPPHYHVDCDLSCVLYLQIPEKMTENHIANSSPPGSIIFMYGENLKHCVHNVIFTPNVGDFFIFPAWLKHYATPFQCEGERISLSANLKEQ